MAWLEKGNFLEAEKILNHVWEDLDRLEDISQEDKDIILGYKNGYRGSISIHSQMEAGQTRQFTKLAGDLLPDQEIMGRSVAYGHYGSACLHLGNLDEADAALSQALTLSKSLDYSLLHLLWLSYQAQVVAARGRLAQAKGLFEDAFQFAESLGVQKSNVFSNSVIGLGSLYYEWNDLEAAEKTLNEGVSIAESGDYLDRLMVGYLSFVQLRLTMGDYQTLEEKIAYVRNIAKKYRYPYRVMQGIDAMQTRIDMTNGDLQKASAWAESIKPPPNFDEMDILQEYQLSTLASVWMAAGKYALAVNLLQSLLGMARKQKRWRDVIRLGNMLAVAHKQNGEMSIAHDTLKDSLQRGREEGYVRSFLDLGTEMQALLTILSTKSQGLSKELLTYIEKLLESFRLEKKDVITEQGAGPRLLTAREMEVMRALSKGLTYAIIARNLVISENTLKSHIKNIYSKLEVNNRTQAILQAEKKGLLS
jgi:LuxR family maltose regulon positive regulatory protein